jgi:hypothetical protein
MCACRLSVKCGGGRKVIILCCVSRSLGKFKGSIKKDDSLSCENLGLSDLQWGSLSVEKCS